MKNSEKLCLRSYTSEEISELIDNIKLCSNEAELNDCVETLKFAVKRFAHDKEQIIEKQDQEISCLERKTKVLEEEYEDLENELHQSHYCVIGDYDELKRQMETNGLWDDKIEFWMENFCRFNNQATQ